MKLLLLIIMLFSNVAQANGSAMLSPNPIPLEVVNDSLPVGGYVAYINTPTYGDAFTKRILVDFGNSGGRNAVLFESSNLLFARKITITEVKTCEFKDDDGKMAKCVGISSCGTIQCDIQMLTGKSKKAYRLILLHEYMHCMGFKDLKEKKYKHDLMYYAENKVYEKNIKEYAKKAHERQSVWKNLKN